MVWNHFSYKGQFKHTKHKCCLIESSNILCNNRSLKNMKLSYR
jgi:hypothetical protein